MANGGSEDYLKALYVLGCADSGVSVSGLARQVGVSPPSASAMLRRLEARGLVERDRFGTVALTADGVREALRVLRRHRLVETFLHTVLDIPWDEVHAEAEVLEHAISDRLEHRLAAYLGHPTHDPHGDPIPSPDRPHDEVPAGQTSLLSAPPGRAVVVRRVLDQRPAVLRELASMGLVPDVRVVVDRVDAFGGPVWLTTGDGTVVVLSRELAESVRITVEPERGAA